MNSDDSRKRGGARDAAKAVAVVALSLAVAFSLASCRDSDVLTEKIAGDPYEYEVDETLSPVAVENPEASSNMSQKEDDSDREDEREEEDPDYDDESPDTDEETSDTHESDLSDDDSESSSGDSVSDETSGSTVSDGGEGESSAPTITFDFTGDPSILGPGDEDSDSAAGEEGEDGDGWIPSTSSSTGSSSEPTGTTVVLPGSGNGYADLPTVSSIAAAGSIATLVQAIGGEGVLAVCNTEWYESLPDEAFSNKSELSDVTCLDKWDDGSSMEDCYKKIASNLPQDWSAAVVVDENTHESSYDEYFNNHSIYVIVLEAYGTDDVNDDWIVDDVEVVSELIGTDYALSQKQAWNAVYTEAMESTLSANGGYSCWPPGGVARGGSTSSGMYVLYKGISSNGYFTSSADTAISYISNNLYYFSFAYSMVDANCDTVTVGSDSNASNVMLLNTYRSQYGESLWPYESVTNDEDWELDVTDGFALGLEESRQSKWSNRSKWATVDYYLQVAGGVNTLGDVNFYLDDTSTKNTGTCKYSDASVYDYGYTIMLGGFYRFGVDEFEGASVAGDENYPLVIAQTPSIAKRIASSAGTYDEANTTVGIYNTGEDYTVAVMPCGISGSWTYGTFESFLMAPYFYCLWQQGGDLSACDTYVNDFYNQFYRCGADVLENTSTKKDYGWYGYLVDAEANVG